VTTSRARLPVSPPVGPAATPLTGGGDSRAFRPARGCRGPHRQTVAGRIVRSGVRCRYERETVATPDGDRLSLDWGVPPTGAPAPAPPAPVLLILHGLEGSSASGYVRETVRSALAAGLRPVALNFRSCDGAPNLRLRSYHSGETGDPALILDRLRERAAGAPIVAVGYSLGGNVLLKLLGEAGARAGLAAAAAVSVPFDLGTSARHLERPAARIYTRYFLRSLRRKAREKARRYPGAFDAEAADRARTLRAFDDAVTAPVHGFADAEDYYARASSLPRLGEIRVPTLLVQAADDPFVPPDTLGAVGEVRNPALRLVFPERGGHLGFLAPGPGLVPRPWVETAAVAFLAERAGQVAILGQDTREREETVR
jgi:uncharacterized protein